MSLWISKKELEEGDRRESQIQYLRCTEKDIGPPLITLLRAQAKLMSESNLRDLFELSRSTKEKTSDKLKAMAAIAEIADIKPRNEQQFSGMVLNVNFGSDMTPPSVAQLTPMEVIEHEQP